MSEKLLTPADVAARLQVEETTVTEWLRTNALSGVKLGRLWRVTEAALLDFLKRSAMRYRVTFKSWKRLDDRMDGKGFLFCFETTPTDKVETPLHDSTTRRAAFRVTVSRTILACNRWPEFQGGDKALAVQLFAFLQERMQRDGIEFPTERGEDLITVRFDTQTEGGRFTGGPIYSPQYVKMDKPFEAFEAVVAGTGAN